MAIKNIIAKGIGFSPGSTIYIPTHGFYPVALAELSGAAGGFVPRLYGTHYSIWLKTPGGKRIALIERFTRLQYTLAANQVGVAKLDLPPSFNLAAVQEDSQLEIYRQVPGGTRYLEGETVWLIRDWEEMIDQQGYEGITLLAYTANEQLDRPIVAYASGSSQASKSDEEIDNMMKALVRENFGALATDPDRDFSAYLGVEADTSAGPESSKAVAWRQLLAVLRELAQDADDKGSPVFFDVIKEPGGNSLRFVTFSGQRGTNHGKEAGQRVILSPRSGTLSEVRRSYQTSQERNLIYVGGQGEGSEREVITVSDTARIGVSPTNRREYFADARNTEAAAGLTAEGQATLKNFRVREVFSAKLRDSQAVKYGREYKFGDRLVMEFKNRVVEVRLDAVEVTMDRGVETIRCELRSDEFSA